MDNLSDHSAISISLDIPVEYVVSNKIEYYNNTRPLWHKMKDEHLKKYQETIDSFLNIIIIILFIYFFKGTVVDNHYGKFIHDNIWYTGAYIHSDNHIYTSPSHADSHSHLHIQIHAHLKTHMRPYPHVQDSYFHIEHEYKSYCQKLNIIAYYMDKLSYLLL